MDESGREGVTMSGMERSSSNASSVAERRASGRMQCIKHCANMASHAYDPGSSVLPATCARMCMPALTQLSTMPACGRHACMSMNVPHSTPPCCHLQRLSESQREGSFKASQDRLVRQERVLDSKVDELQGLYMGAGSAMASALDSIKESEDAGLWHVVSYGACMHA